MSRSRPPRIFGLAGGVLLIYLVLVTYHYNYHYNNNQRGWPSDQSPPKAFHSDGDVETDDFSQHLQTLGSVSVGAGADAATDASGSSGSSGSSEVDHATAAVAPVFSSGQCPKLDFLKRAHRDWHFSDKIRYNRVCIKPVFKADVDRSEVANVSRSFFGGEVTVDLEDCSAAKPPPCIPTQLQVPPPYGTHNVSHLVFGVSTDYDRLRHSIRTFAHWLAAPPGLGARLVALVTDFDQYRGSDIGALERQFRDANMEVHLVGPLDDSYSTSQSHFTVLAHMLDYSAPATQWFGFLDDDTFFPRGLKPLSDALGTLDPSKDVYAGALSEDFMAIRTFGFMAFGGAGAYLSAPLAWTLGAQIQQCVEGAADLEGDIIIRDCVYSNSRAKLTMLPGLYQQDLKDDASGFFESGLEPINLHHWKSWYKEPVVKLAAAAIYCGDCFLQRWRFGADVVFTNGYSIAKYIHGVKHLDLETMEGTWTNANQDFDFSIGPLRRKLVQGEKKVYKLIDAEISDSGVLKQLYRWEGNSAVGEDDGIVEFVWKQ